MGIFKKNEPLATKPYMCVKLVRQGAGKMIAERLNITNDEAGTYSVGLDQIKLSLNPYLDMGGMVVTKDDFLHIYEMKRKGGRTELAQEIHKALEKEMCGLTQEWAIGCLGTEKLLRLMTIANNDILGVKKAIAYAYMYGYLSEKNNSHELAEKGGGADE